MTLYTITALKPNLYYIRWTGVPSTQEGLAFVKSQADLLNNAAHPLYFISDLRRGYIDDVQVVRKLGKLAGPENWAGGVAFSGDMISSVYVGMYSKFAPDEKPAAKDGVFHPTLEEAIAHLEALQPGLTLEIDWTALLSAPDSYATRT